MDKNELLWKHYELHINTYRGYLELVLKINIFYYAITGAILSYYFAHSDQPLIKFALAFPIVMSLFFAVLFFIGAYLAKWTRRDVNELANELGFKVAPETGVLILVLVIFAILMLLLAGGLIYLVSNNIPALSVYAVLMLIVVCKSIHLIFCKKIPN